MSEIKAGPACSPDLAELRDWIMSSARPACIKHSVATLERLPDGRATCGQCVSRLVD